MDFKRYVTASVALAIAVAGGLVATAQSVVPFGKGSIASEPPTYELTQDQWGGWSSKASQMVTKKLYVDELPPVNIGGLEAPGRPIPTNDWWTDIINRQFSGALWSYPQMLNTSGAGVEICYPTYWADYGKEVKSKSSVTVGAVNFTADAAIAEDWHDWDVRFRMPQQGNGVGVIRVTAVQGMPFTWFEYNSACPELSFGSRNVDNNATTPYPAGTKAIEIAKGEGRAAFKFGDDTYGIYYPANSTFQTTETGGLRFSKGTKWIVVALLTDIAQLDTFEKYAVSIPRDTRVDWAYDAIAGRINTTWTVKADNLRGGQTTAVLQGLLPHVWKHALRGHSLTFSGDEYLTPRGTMKMAASASGVFTYSYSFNGMLPAYVYPGASTGFDTGIMKGLTDKYAAQGTMGDDTYWGGKGLTQMALNMTFAKQTGNTEAYELSKKKLRDTFVNWLTYTPGEHNYYMSYFKRWGGILGSAVSYGSDEFNDHHFHYGYFTYAAALLCMEDPDFAREYGDVLTLIAKDYANWDRNDSRFPFMRTLDLWAGHSWAGGLGDGGNDNGNGQESTSEAMQGWGGIYLLGVALGNDEMRDAGLFGWATEARGTREYWFDVDQPRPANAGGRKAWNGKGSRQGCYDYSLYPYAYNSNITCKGIGWWTWFGGDPLFMHGIQWMPVSPALDYLSWDPDFVAWAYDDMMSGANSAYSHAWFEDTTNSDNGDPIDALAKNDWGNVTLAYMQRANPALAAEIFDRALREGYHIATSVSTSHISYYTIHNTLTYGLPDTSCHADCPTATVFVKDGKQTFMAYNPGNDDLTVHFYNSDGSLIKTVTAPGRTTTVFDKGEPRLTDLDLVSEEGFIIPAGSSTILTAKAFDQYGANFKTDISVYTDNSDAATVNNGVLKINPTASNGSKVQVIISAGLLKKAFEFTVNPKPVPGNIRIEGATESIELGNELDLSLCHTDQYGTETVEENAKWTYTTTAGASGQTTSHFAPVHPGMYTITASAGNVTALTDIFVMPKLPCISRGVKAVSSSEENVGTATTNVNDGDTGSRWSSQFTDDEWIYLDLGADMFVSRVGVLWEASYASIYEIQLAKDGCPTTKHTGSYAGNNLTYTVPAEWTTVATETQLTRSTSEVSTTVNATGRYVRIKGVKRALDYGYSIYEFNVYGISASVGPDDLLGIDFALPQAMDQGQTATLNLTAYSRSGKIITTPALTWSADKPAEFTANGFRPLSYGNYTVTATTPDGRMTSETCVFVYESRKLEKLGLSAENVEMVEGASASVTIEGYDRFDCRYPINPDQLAVTVMNTDGKPVNGASYDSATALVVGDTKGTYTLRFEYEGKYADCTVNVKAFADTNLALHKSARASGDEGGNKAEYATDGNIGTRWSSAWEEGQWIIVDLEDYYILDRMALAWENAYAKDYHIEASLDGNEWKRVYTKTDSKGGNESFTLDTPAPARYVRLTGDRRAMEAYGISIYEWEVYGTGRYELPDNGSSPDFYFFALTPGAGSIRVEATAEDINSELDYIIILSQAETEIERREGTVRSGQDVDFSFKGLSKGQYDVKVSFANKYGRTSTRTLTTVVTREDQGGIDSVTADDEQPINWYTIEGRRIEAPTTPGYYIRRQGNRAEKILFR